MAVRDQLSKRGLRAVGRRGQTVRAETDPRKHRDERDAVERVLVVNVELCSLHLQETDNLEQMLSFLLFADGCAASVVSAEPEGLAIDRFHAAQLPDTRQLITWKIRELGFDMFLQVRNKIVSAYQEVMRMQV